MACLSRSRVARRAAADWLMTYADGVDEEAFSREEPMSEDYLPEIYSIFRERFPDLSQHLDALAASQTPAPLTSAQAASSSSASPSGRWPRGPFAPTLAAPLAAGATPEELLHVVALTVTTRGFPAAVAAYSWIEDVLSSRLTERHDKVQGCRHRRTSTPSDREQLLFTVRLHLANILPAPPFTLVRRQVDDLLTCLKTQL